MRPRLRATGTDKELRQSWFMCDLQTKSYNRGISSTHTGSLSCCDGVSTASTWGIQVKTAEKNAAKANIEENAK